MHLSESAGLALSVRPPGQVVNDIPPVLSQRSIRAQLAFTYISIKYLAAIVFYLPQVEQRLGFIDSACENFEIHFTYGLLRFRVGKTTPLREVCDKTEPSPDLGPKLFLWKTQQTHRLFPNQSNRFHIGFRAHRIHRLVCADLQIINPFH